MKSPVSQSSDDVVSELILLDQSSFQSVSISLRYEKKTGFKELFQFLC